MTWKDFEALRVGEAQRNDWGRYTEMAVECPNCGASLFRDNLVVLSTYPPMHKYICKKCEWVGHTY